MKRNLAKLCAVFIAALLVVSGIPVSMSSSETFNIGTAQPQSGTNWHFDANAAYFDFNQDQYRTIPTLFVNNGANLTITGTSTPTQNHRVVVTGNASITLNNAVIERSGDAIRVSLGTNPATYVPVSPLMLEPGANLTLTLVGDNRLAMAEGSGNRWSAGLGVPRGAALTIQGDGSLYAEGGLNAAGIGGHEGTHLSPRISGDITINSGNITAVGRILGAGIGGGSLLQHGRIRINGGNVNASVTGTANNGGAGIGSGDGASFQTTDSVITITGGVINATGGRAAAGIGGGNNSPNAGAIGIFGGRVTATGGSSALWGGAGIGGGFAGNAEILIAGGIIIVTGGVGNNSGGAGIGGGGLAHAGCITIGGGAVSATGAGNSEDIGASAGPSGPLPGGSVAVSGNVFFLTETKTFYGDADGSYSLSAADITILRRFIASSQNIRDNYENYNPMFNRQNADVNGDGYINSTDVTLLRMWLAAPAGDKPRLGA